MADDPRFHLQGHLDRLYAHGRGSACVADEPAALRDWQERGRRLLRELLGVARRPIGGGAPRRLSQRAEDGYREERWAVPVTEDVDINCYLLLPEGSGPHVPVVVFHGHNPDVGYIIGRYPDAETARRRLAAHGNYAQALARAGYLVCAVEQRGFGARVSDGHGQRPEVPYTDRHLFLSYLLMGRCLQGERVVDGLRIVDWLSARSDIRTDRFAALGQSGGGTTATYLAAVDERVRVVVPGCSFAAFRDSLLSAHFPHCLCNYVPGILDHFEHGDLAALIAPRPLCVISGAGDVIFPIDSARAQFRTVHRAYTVLGAGERCRHHIHDDDHRYDIDAAMAWLARWCH